MKNFQGDKSLQEAYVKYIEDVANTYNNGYMVCFAGTYGIGKSLVSTNILKLVCQKNYTSLYSTLNDIVSALIDNYSEDKYIAKKELMTIDFLVIDEFDPRYFNSGQSSELFGKTFETIMRTRLQNKLPTIFCSNSPNPIEGFTGNFKQSIESLMSNVKFVSVVDKDFRKEKSIK